MSKNQGNVEGIRPMGTWRVQRYDREEWLKGNKVLLGEKGPHSNALTTAGRDRIVDILVNPSTGAKFDSTSQLVIRNAGGTTVQTLGADKQTSAPSAVGTPSLTAEWTDDSTDSYSATQLRPYFGTSIVLSHSVPSFGTKPDTEIWIYQYTLSYTAPGTEITDNGMLHVLRLMTGQETVGFGSASLQVFRGAGVDPNGETTTYSQGSPSTISRVSGNLRMTWVASPGQGEAAWEGYKIDHANISGARGFRWGDFTDSSMPDTKVANEEWTLQYTLNVDA